MSRIIGTLARDGSDESEPFRRETEPDIRVLSVEEEADIDSIYGPEYRGQEIPDELVEWERVKEELAFAERVRDLADHKIVDAAGRL